MRTHQSAQECIIAAPIPAVFQRYQAAYIDEMQALLAARQLPIYDMIRYHLGWQEANGQPRHAGGGKGMRPALCLLTADALDGSPGARARALPGAAAVEFVHNYSLVHDDIQDGDEQRHHRPTVWVQWGMGQGINVGDALRELAQLALRRAHAAGADAETVLVAIDALTHAGLEMIEGQYLDLTFEQRTEVTLSEYLDMIERKTGAMIGCSLQIGALLATGDQAQAEGLRRAGRRLGLLFQIRDDYLGIWGDSARTGKPSDNDIRRRKKSLPVVYTFANATAPDRTALERAYSQRELSQADVATVMRIAAETNAAEATIRLAHQQYDAFLTELEGCGVPAPGRVELVEVADFLLGRDH